jgi:predicted alpha/beta-fold hydrolase
MAELARRFPGRPLHAVGFSLGGNALLRLLGEGRHPVPLASAAAVSVPFDLALCSRRLRSGLSRLYDRHLVGRLRRALLARVGEPGFPVTRETLRGCRDLRTFDDRVTAPLHGYRGVDHYYREAGSRPVLGAIRTPTLILHARDDPFMFPEVIPRPEELAPAVRLEVSVHGGHVGFVEAPGRYWLDRRLLRWLRRAT